jgi:hypothetical protein
MTLDTYTHLLEQARHGADIRSELAKSTFANLLDVTLAPRLRAGEHLRPTRAAIPRRLQNRPERHHRCAPHGASERCLHLTKT